MLVVVGRRSNDGFGGRPREPEPDRPIGIFEFDWDALRNTAGVGGTGLLGLDGRPLVFDRDPAPIVALAVAPAAAATAAAATGDGRDSDGRLAASCFCGTAGGVERGGRGGIVAALLAAVPNMAGIGSDRVRVCKKPVPRRSRFAG